MYRIITALGFHPVGGHHLVVDLRLSIRVIFTVFTVSVYPSYQFLDWFYHGNAPETPFDKECQKGRKDVLHSSFIPLRVTTDVLVLSWHNANLDVLV